MDILFRSLVIKLKDQPITSIKGDGFGRFTVIYADQSFEVFRREEMLWALKDKNFNEAEATAFKYADCCPNTIQTVS